MKKLRVILIALIALVIGLNFYITPTYAESGHVVGGDSVYVGGFPIGISIDVGGLLVESVTGVETEYGTATVEGIVRGDIIKSIDGKDVVGVDDIPDKFESDTVEVKLLRDGEMCVVKVKPLVEAFSGKPRLGIKIKDKLYGVGTVTFVDADGKYAALGHEIYDGDTDTHIPFAGGKIHACKIIGVKHGKRGEAGAILASIVPDKVYGSITCNNNFGIAGRFTSAFDKSECMEVASRGEVMPGAAKIRTTVDGSPTYYDIEIIKASKQSGRKEKGIAFRVTDKKLLELTGGVVRGMSGSPIIQNGKLVGAVTHVFLNDFCKGYGVYVDCLNRPYR